MTQLNSQIHESKCIPFLHVEMQFPTWERAQRAAALVNGLKSAISKVTVSEMLFEDYGRRLVLEFSSSGALPSELVSYVFAVVDAASAERPLTRNIDIPLVQN